MNDSYIKMNATKAGSLAVETVDYIDREREAYFTTQSQALRTRHARWQWLPWWKPLTDEEVRYSLLMHDRSGSWLHDDHHTRAHAIIRLALAGTKRDDIYVSSDDLHHIQFGQRHATPPIQATND